MSPCRWVFSGRRGVHCWVCDPSARALADNERTAIVQYLSVISGNENTADRCAITQPLHPSLELAMPVLNEVFESMVLDDENGQALMKVRSLSLCLSTFLVLLFYVHRPLLTGRTELGRRRVSCAKCNRELVIL
jgi:hypothetical protein